MLKDRDEATKKEEEAEYIGERPVVMLGQF